MQLEERPPSPPAPFSSGRAVPYQPTTASPRSARPWRASIWRLKSLPMATSSPRSAWGTAKQLVISTREPSRRPRRVPMTRPAPSARRVWWSRTERRTSGWTVTEETASDEDADDDGSSRRAGEEPYVAGEALSVPIWCVLFFVRCMVEVCKGE